MSNPWKTVDLDAYEKHMSLESVFQLQTMNDMMKEQFYSYEIKSIMILGIAGGNGLNHVDKDIFDKVYGVDINETYLKACEERYAILEGIFETICTDLTQDEVQLPHADMIVANLLIEYIGYECFQKTVIQVKPKYISCIIQINTDVSFVSDSPYLHEFDRISEVHHQMEEQELIDTMNAIGYIKIKHDEKELPNGKKFVRIDFSC